MIKQILGRIPRKTNPKPSPDDPAGPTKQQSSTSETFAPLPSFRDVPAADRPSLFLRKLSLCSVVLDFSDPTKTPFEKDLKRQSLLDLVDYVATSPSTSSSKFPETHIQESVRMVSANLFRAFPNADRPDASVDVDDDDPAASDPSWPHLQLVYEFLLRLVASPDLDAKLAKRHVDHSFVLRLLDLFDSEDHREREYLKTVLHRVYGKFMVHRPFIRRAINNIFYRFIFETERHNGIAELLEILGSIINGFALPLKEEHKLFLARALIPLHKPKRVGAYHQQLAYCVTQFVEKDAKLADAVVRGMLKYWPVTNSSKEVMFLGELEEVLEVTQAAEFQRCMVPLFRQIGRCLNSSHFQNVLRCGMSSERISIQKRHQKSIIKLGVAERALFLWNNDHVRNLITQNRKVILPIIFPALEKNTRGHWNPAVQSLTLNVRKLFLDADQELFEECLLRFQEDEAKEKEMQAKREMLWKRLEEVAASKATVSSEAVLVSRVVSSLGLASNTSPRTAVST